MHFFFFTMLNVHKWKRGLRQVVSFLLLEVFKQSIDTSSSGHTQHGADSHVRLSGNTRVRSTSRAFASYLFNSTLAHTVYPIITHSYMKCLGTHFTYLGTRLLLPAAASEHPHSAALPRSADPTAGETNTAISVR